MSTPIRSRRMLAFAALLPLIGLLATPAATRTFTVYPHEETAAMKTFVIIFHQGSRPLTDAEKQRRSEETGPWARRQNGAGHKLDPRILGPESAQRGAEGSAPPADASSSITALLFLEARDLNEAADIAASHPGLRYGARVEVRPWAPPVPAAPPAAR